MIYLAAVTHDIKFNTLEATWLDEIKDSEGNLIDLKRVKCRNYTPAQKAEFLADTGEEGQKYVDLAGW